MAFAFSHFFDQHFLQSLYEDDIVYAQEVFKGFLCDTKNEFEQIKTLFGQGDLKNVRQRLHKVKPVFSFVGLTALTEETERVISACDNAGNTADIGPLCSVLFEKIEGSFGLVENELVRMRNYTG